MVPAGRFLVNASTDGWNAEWRLTPLGDIHWGALGCCVPLLYETIGRIAEDPRALWVGMGDYLDLISIRDERRFDNEAASPEGERAHFSLKGYATELRDQMVAMLSPIRDKCLGLLHGNHEKQYSRRLEQAVGRSLAQNLEVPFLGMSFFRDLVFVNGDRVRVVRIAGHHGAGTAQTKGGKLNRAERFAKSAVADLVLIGHMHGTLDDDIVQIAANDDCSDLKAVRKVVLITGTYLETYCADADGRSGYGEDRMYDPVPLGSPCVKIVPSARRLSIEKP